MNKYVMLPYRSEQGQYLFNDGLVRMLYGLLERDGLSNLVFYQNDIKNSLEFVEHCKKPGVCLYIIFNEKIPVCCIWLDGFNGKSAQINYFVFRKAMPKYSDAVKFGRKFIQEILNKKDDDFILGELIGTTPIFNKRSVYYSIHCGGKIVGQKLVASNPCHIIKFERSQPWEVAAV